MDFDDVRTRALSGRILSDVVDVPRHVLTHRSGAHAGARHTAEGTRLSIGSAPGNDVVIADETVSRHHAEITTREGRRILRDLGSTNGTLLEGVEVMEAVLPDQAQLTLGGVELDYTGTSRLEQLAPSAAHRFGELVGSSEGMRRTFALCARIAPTTLSCLVLGETGTGKELAARSIHDASLRASGPFVVVDCAAIQRNLFESQLFGHERGAFTGAEKQHRGAFEQAQGGTLFFDEIGELPLDLQPRLLRALERREVVRLGASRTVDIDVRVVAATHRDLSAMVQAGTFREDLFYRFAEMLVTLPPLRERLSDLGAIAHAVLAASFGAGAPRLAPAALDLLMGQRWPGNIRELRNVLRRATAFAERGEIDLHALTAAMAHAGPSNTVLRAVSGEAMEVHPELPLKDARDAWLEKLETRYLAAVLERFGDDLDAAAAHVGVHRKSYQRLLRERGITRE